MKAKFETDVRRFALFAVATGLMACSPAQQDELTRRAAKSVVTPVVAETFPGVPLEPSVNCLIDNATSTELLSLASDSVTGPTASTTQTVIGIARRPETLQCMAVSGLPALFR